MIANTSIKEKYLIVIQIAINTDDECNDIEGLGKVEYYLDLKDTEFEGLLTTLNETELENIKLNSSIESILWFQKLNQTGRNLILALFGKETTNIETVYNNCNKHLSKS